MDRTGDVYFVKGGGIVSGLGGTVATGKLSVDTSGWDESKFRKSIEGEAFLLVSVEHWYQ